MGKIYTFRQHHKTHKLNWDSQNDHGGLITSETLQAPSEWTKAVISSQGHLFF